MNKDMKQYIDAKMAIVSLQHNDIVTASGRFGNSTSTQLAPGMREFDDYYEGY